MQKKFSKSYSLPEGLIERLNTVSNNTGKPKSRLVMEALEKHLEQYESEPTPLRKIKEAAR